LNMGDPNSVADPKWVYVPEIFGLFLPWSGFLVFSFIVAFRNLRSKSEPALLTIVWFFVMFLFFSLSSGRKFVRYLLPLFPSLALIVGSMWSKYMTGTRERFLRIGMSWSAILLIVVFGLAVVIMLLMAGRWWVPTEYEPYIVVALPFTVIFAAGVVICATLVITGKSRRAFLALALGTAISFSALVLLASVYLDEILVTKQLVGEVRNEILTCERVGSYRYPKPNSFILYANRYVTLMSRPAELDEFLEQEGRVCCIVMESDLRDVTDEFYRQGRRLDYRILAQKFGAAIIENYHK